MREISAATYSRASYTGTTIGKTMFDGRVRDGIGSGHRFIATDKSCNEPAIGEAGIRDRGCVFVENCM